MRNFLGFIIFLALLFGLGLYFSKEISNLPSSDNKTDTIPTTIIASTTHSHIIDKKSKYEADIYIPIISGHNNDQAFNNSAKIYVDRATEEFIQNATEANFNLPDTFKDQLHNLIAVATTSIVGNRYVNTIFDREYDMLGTAHPSHSTESLVYDLENKKIIELKDIFINVNQALEYVSAKSKEQIINNLKSSDNNQDSLIEEGITAQEANYRVFGINANGITFYFGEYQVLPYVFGPQKSYISWYDLRPLLTPEFKNFLPQ